MFEHYAYVDVVQIEFWHGFPQYPCIQTEKLQAGELEYKWRMWSWTIGFKRQHSTASLTGIWL